MTTYDDWRAETVARLPHSAIFRELEKRCAAEPGGHATMELAHNATFYAFQKTKTILRHMGEFTLHDGDHLFRVLLLMERLIPVNQLNALSTPELLLLVLSAFFHDLGMAAEERDVASWRKVWDTNPSFDDARDREEWIAFRRHCVARPERMSRIQSLESQGEKSAANLARDYLVTDFIRATHAERARTFIERDWLGKIKYRDADLTAEFAAICYSHSEDGLSVLELDRKYLCGPDVYACLPLVAVLLRLADILDFDAKRTPDVLYSHLFVRNPVSLGEWAKHRAVEAWSINPMSIQFHAKCGHPAIQASIHDFCDLIDHELGVCNNVLSTLNDFHHVHGRELHLSVPLRVDRTKIETRKTVRGKPEYIYRRTQFSLSKSQVVDLLMGTKLYGDSKVALRELVQNSIDACLLRKALEEAWGNSYVPQVRVRYYMEDCAEVLEVTDNGVGMDQYIVDNYYSRVGSSFYVSPDFHDLRAQTGSKFVPTSRFGIGILSCFMVADTIEVDTRRVLEAHRSSEPLSITIEGQDSIFWIRDGELATPGTKTRLFLRKRTNPWDRMNEDQFIESVEQVVPNPPVNVSVETSSHTKVRTSTSFRQVRPESLKDYSWEERDYIREVAVELDKLEEGFVGSAIFGVLEQDGVPVGSIEMTSRTVSVEDDKYDLEKKLLLDRGSIKHSSTSISIDVDGNIEQSSSGGTLANSRSLISLHGIEIPTTLFPQPWETRSGQVKLDLPLPALLVVDVCGTRDLDLNSSRTQIVLTDKWLSFEEALLSSLTRRVAEAVGAKYWRELKKVMLAGTRNDRHRAIIDQIEGPRR